MQAVEPVGARPRAIQSGGWRHGGLLRESAHGLTRAGNGNHKVAAACGSTAGRRGRAPAGPIRRNDSVKTVKELLRTNDPVEISWVCALLADAGIEAAVFDAHTSVVEGSIGAIPRRVTVADEDFAAARRILDEAGVG